MSKEYLQKSINILTSKSCEHPLKYQSVLASARSPISVSQFILGWILILSACPLLSQNRIFRIDTLTIAAVGDIMVHDAQIASAKAQAATGYNFRPTFTLIRPFLTEADLTVGNLETTLPGNSTRYSGYPCFGAPDDLVKTLKWAGFDLLSTANNHACDKGKKTFIRTLNVLDTLEIQHLGTYRNDKEFKNNRICYVFTKGFKLAFLNYTYGTNGIPVPEGLKLNDLNRNQIIDDIRLARAEKPDIIIIMLHYGTEYKRLPTKAQKEWVDFCFYHGADVVLGGHPHVVQPFELLRRTDKYDETRTRLVMWSLGNFVSNQKRPYTDNGILFHFKLIRVRYMNGTSTLHFEDIHYTPVYVYERKTGRHLHVIIPTEMALLDSADSRLPETLRANLRNSLSETRHHLKQSLDKTEEYLNNDKINTVSSNIY